MLPPNNIQNRTLHPLSLIVALAGLIRAATLVLGTARIASAQTVYPGWSYTGNLNTAPRGSYSDAGSKRQGLGYGGSNRSGD